jgi:hypothetical protein
MSQRETFHASWVARSAIGNSPESEGSLQCMTIATGLNQWLLDPKQMKRLE